MTKPKTKQAAGSGEAAAGIKKAAVVLARDAILAADDIKKEKVPVPEWGGAVFVKSMNGAERDEFDAEMEERTAKAKDGGIKAANANMRALVVSLTVVDAAGERLFGEADIPALAAKNGHALTRVFAAAMRFNGLRNADVEAAVKN